MRTVNINDLRPQQGKKTNPTRPNKESTKQMLQAKDSDSDSDFGWSGNSDNRSLLPVNNNLLSYYPPPLLSNSSTNIQKTTATMDSGSTSNWVPETFPIDNKNHDTIPSHVNTVVVVSCANNS